MILAGSESWKDSKIQDFNVVWTRDLAIPVDVAPYAIA